MADDKRFDFCLALQEELKHKNFWVTDFLAQRIMDVEATFCCGNAANGATVQRCAEYSEELLKVDHPETTSVESRLLQCPLSPQVRQEVRDLLRLKASGESSEATESQAYAAVSAFMHLVFTRAEA